MGNYNPHAPIIIGEEWVPIREEQLTYSPSVNSVELGTKYTQAASQRIRTARFYANEMPPTLQLNQCALVNLYPTGTEDQTGPIKQVIIPVNTVTVTGSGITNFGGSTGAEVVYQPGDGKALEFDYNGTAPAVGTAQRASFYFAVNDYAQLLNGKRILNVSLVYAGYVQDKDPITGANIDFVNPTPASTMTLIRQRTDTNGGQLFTGAVSGFRQNTGTLDLLSTTVMNTTSDSSGSQVIGVLDIGDINNFWSATTPPSTTAVERQPWRYADLQRFESTFGANRQMIFLQVQMPPTAASAGFITTPTLFLEYVAMRVIYCEEKRVAAGARMFGYSLGANIITMRDLSQNADPVIAAGTYLPTLSWVSPGRVDFGQASNGDFPKLNALRQLYEIPSHPGVQVNVPFPLDGRIGDTFTSESLDILPQVSFHTSGGTMTEPHAYGRQAIAQVYGTITATQEIFDSPAGGSATWQQVRFFARRFGDTTVSLLLDSPTIVGSSVTLTPTEWDALPTLIDGWKEVTKRFSTPPAMGAGTNPQWRFSAAGETAGNRWEILGAMAPAISGVPGSLLTQVPSADRLATATYGATTAGSTINLGWVPGYTPPVSATTDDVSSDAVLIFSQDPATITGFTVNTLTQAVTGFIECGSGPCCTPTAISYNRLTWSPTTIPSSGFGAYDLQRYDAIAAEWQTIMLATSPAITGFNDYEARVGVLSQYQIRQSNVLDFAGLWSITGSATVAEPGVTMPSCGAARRGVLIFTTNEVQDGTSNLAYAMTWDGPAVEDFSFPEVNQLDVQTYLDRDYQVAFHGSERGGEQFSRRLLLANAAVALPRLANTRTLRDLAWDDLAYVCVRDDIGDRWFATIVVPGNEVRRNRRLYNAQISVIEVSGDASQVDP